MTPQRSHSIHAADPAPAMLASLSTDSTRSCAVPGLEPFMRPIAKFVIFAQLALVLQPLSAVAQPKGQVAPNPLAEAQLARYEALNNRINQTQGDTSRPAATPLSLLPETVESARRLIKSLQSATNGRQLKSSANHQDVGLQLNWSQLQSALRAIQSANSQMLADMSSTARQLEQQRAPTAILERQAQAERQLQERIAQFQRIATPLMTAAGSASNDSDKTGITPKLRVTSRSVTRSDVLAAAPALAELERLLGQHSPAKRQASIDPKNLPWGAAKATPRTPSETSIEWLKKLPINTGAKATHSKPIGPALAKPSQKALTIVAGLQFTDPPTVDVAPTDADLSQTTEITITPAIKAKAQELGYNPVAIQNWVRNTIEWQPTWGALQSAETVLGSQKGNAHDIASLTIALLRASKIPARYQWGTIELPASAVMNWVGGVTKPEAALNQLYQGGIAARGYASAGRVTTIRMEHVWVNAYVNQVPSRGSLTGDPTNGQHVNPNASLNAWLPIDGAFKQYSYADGIDYRAAIKMDTAAVLAAAKSSATINDQEGWVQSLKPELVEQAITDQQSKLISYFNGAGIRDATTILGRKIIPERMPPMLSASLPYPLVARGPEASQIPTALQWSFALYLYTSEIDKAAGNYELSYQLPLSSIGSKRIASQGVPASAADADLLENYRRTSATSLPVYLVRQKTVLKVDDAIVASAAARTMGSPEWWSYRIIGPSETGVEEEFKRESAVGDANVFSVDAVGFTAAQASKRYQAVNPNTALENLHHLGLGYFIRTNISDEALAKLKGFVWNRLPSVGLFNSPLTVVYSWGVPRSGTYNTYGVDVPRLRHATVTKEGASTSEWADFNVQLGIKNSYLEAQVIDEVFELPRSFSVAATQVMVEASRQGKKIYRIDSRNASDFFSKARLGQKIEAGMREFINAGYVVTAPAERISTRNWDAEGYIATDPQTGSGAYIVGTGANGAEAAVCEEKTEPLVRAIKDIVSTLIILAIIAGLIAAGLWIGGFVAGGVAGGLAGAGGATSLAQLMAAFGLTALVFSAQQAVASPRCGNDKCHRGTIQAQGLDISAPGNTISEGWAQPMPFTVAEGLAMMTRIEAALTPSQLAARSGYFAAAKAWISSLPPHGICGGGPTKSFGPNPADKDHVKKQIRVDVKVYSGAAFAN